MSQDVEEVKAKLAGIVKLTESELLVEKLIKEEKIKFGDLVEDLRRIVRRNPTELRK